MRRVLLATAAAGILSGALSVQAADYMRPPPAYSVTPIQPDDFNWGGLYGGIHAGYGTGNIKPSALGLNTAFNNATALLGAVPAAPDAMPTLSGQGPFYGGYVGFNWLWEDVVVGLEASYSNFNGQMTAVGVTAGFPGTLAVDSAVQTFKLRDVIVGAVRFGAPFGRFMPYATLGFATGQATMSTTVTATNLGVTAVGGQYKSGWLVGAAAGLGLEYAVTNNILLRGEYQWLGFTNFNGNSGDSGASPTFHTVRAGVAIKY